MLLRILRHHFRANSEAWEKAALVTAADAYSFLHLLQIKKVRASVRGEGASGRHPAIFEAECETSGGHGESSARSGSYQSGRPRCLSVTQGRWLSHRHGAVALVRFRL